MFFTSSKYTLKIWVGSGFAWNRNFCLDPEVGKLKAGSGINHSGSATLPSTYDADMNQIILPDSTIGLDEEKEFFIVNVYG